MWFRCLRWLRCKGIQEKEYQILVYLLVYRLVFDGM